MAGAAFRGRSGCSFGYFGCLLLLLGGITDALRTSLVLAADAYPVVAIGRVAVVTCVLDPHPNLPLHTFSRFLRPWLDCLPLVFVEFEIILFEDGPGLLQAPVDFRLSRLLLRRLCFELRRVLVLRRVFRRFRFGGF